MSDKPKYRIISKHRNEWFTYYYPQRLAVEWGTHRLYYEFMKDGSYTSIRFENLHEALNYITDLREEHNEIDPNNKFYNLEGKETDFHGEPL